jgi:hypothetical protein
MGMTNSLVVAFVVSGSLLSILDRLDSEFQFRSGRFRTMHSAWPNGEADGKLVA